MADEWKPINVADRDPGRNHDARKGYGPGSLWVNSETGGVWVCLDNAANGSRWHRVSFGNESFAKVAETGSYSDLKDRPKLGSAAAVGIGKVRGQVAAADDPRIRGALQAGKNLSDLTDVEAARRKLGISSAIRKILAAKTVKELVEILGLHGMLPAEEAQRLYQPLASTLATLARMELGGMAEKLLTAKTRDEVLTVLGLRIGKDVARWTQDLQNLTAMESFGKRVLLAPNVSAAREIMELKPGADVVEVEAFERVVVAMEKRIADLEARLEAKEKANA